MNPLDELRAALAGEQADDATWQVLADLLQDAGDPEGRVLALVRQMLGSDDLGHAIAAAAEFSDPKWLVDVVARCWGSGERSRVEEGTRRLGLDLPPDRQAEVERWLTAVNGRKRIGRVSSELVVGAAAAALRSEEGFAFHTDPSVQGIYGGRCAVVLAVVRDDRLVVGAAIANAPNPYFVPGWPEAMRADSSESAPSSANARIAQAWAGADREDHLGIPIVAFEPGPIDARGVEDWVRRRRAIDDTASEHLAQIPDTKMVFDGQDDDDEPPDFGHYHYANAHGPEGPGQPVTTSPHLVAHVWGPDGVTNLLQNIEAGVFASVRTLQLFVSDLTPGQVRRLVDTDLVKRVTTLDLSQGGDPPVDLQPLFDGCPQVRELALDSRNLGMAEIPRLDRLTHLRRLRLSGSWAVSAIRELLDGLATPLDALELEGPTDLRTHDLVAALAPCGALSALRFLHLPEQTVDDSLVQGIVEAHPTLTGLELRGMDALAPTTVQRIVQGLSGLRALCLSGRQIGERGLGFLIDEEPALQTLRVAHCAFGDSGMTALARSGLVEQLRRLDVSNNRFRVKGIREFVKSPRRIQLLELRLARCKIGKTGARLLAEWPGLSHVQTLDMTYTGMGAEGAKRFASSVHFQARRHHGFPSDFRARHV